MTDIESLRSAKSFIREKLEGRFPWIEVGETGVSFTVLGTEYPGLSMVGSAVDSEGRVNYSAWHFLIGKLGERIAFGIFAVQLLHRAIEKMSYCGEGPDITEMRDNLLDLLDSCDDVTSVLWDGDTDCLDMFVSWVDRYIEEPTPFVFSMMIELIRLLEERGIDDERLQDVVLQEFNDATAPNNQRVARLLERHISQNLTGSDMKSLLTRLDAIENLNFRSLEDHRRWWRDWWTVVLSALHPEKVGDD